MIWRLTLFYLNLIRRDYYAKINAFMYVILSFYLFMYVFVFIYMLYFSVFELDSVGLALVLFTLNKDVGVLVN